MISIPVLHRELAAQLRRTISSLNLPLNTGNATTNLYPTCWHPERARQWHCATSHNAALILVARNLLSRMALTQALRSLCHRCSLSLDHNGIGRIWQRPRGMPSRSPDEVLPSLHLIFRRCTIPEQSGEGSAGWPNTNHAANP
jgi:hypothetical protein